MPTSPFSHRGIWVVLVAMLCTLTACDDTAIDPFDNDERYYTIYGYLDVLETNHKVRIIPITRRAERIESPIDAQAEIDAVVTSTDLRTGETRSWSHSLEKLDDGTYGHIFRSNFIVWPGHTYRLEVKRSDDVTATAETTVPRVVEEPLFEWSDVTFSSDSTEVFQDVHIPTIASPWNIQGIYLFSNAVDLNARFFVPYDRTGERTADGGWRFRLNISTDQFPVQEEVQGYINQDVYDPDNIILSAIGVQVRILDANWDPPEGIFDPEVLAQPGRLSNVENGYGFWGSIGLYREEWTVLAPLSQTLGYCGLNNLPSVFGSCNFIGGDGN